MLLNLTRWHFETNQRRVYLDQKVHKLSTVWRIYATHRFYGCVTRRLCKTCILLLYLRMKQQIHTAQIVLTLIVAWHTTYTLNKRHSVCIPTNISIHHSGNVLPTPLTTWTSGFPRLHFYHLWRVPLRWGARTDARVLYGASLCAFKRRITFSRWQVGLICSPGCSLPLSKHLCSYYATTHTSLPPSLPLSLSPPMHLTHTLVRSHMYTHATRLRMLVDLDYRSTD